jgi:hypothetical protein
MERTNVTDSGYTYNGQNFVKETRTDSQGNKYTVDVPSAISTAQLAKQTPVNVVQPQYNDVSTLASTASAYVNSAFEQEQANVDDLNKQALSETSDIAKLQRQLGDKSSDLATQYQTVDETGTSVNSLAAQLRKLSAQSRALEADTFAKTLAEQNKATGQNITSQAVQRNTADVTRENAIKIAQIAMQSAIVKADYDTAKDLADQIVNAKYDKIQADITAKLTNLAGLKDYSLTPSQKKLADAQTAKLKKQEQEIADKKENDKASSKLIIDASPVAPPDVLSRAKDIQANGGSATDVALALGEYGGDFIKNQLLKEQIITERKQREKLDADISKTRAETSQTGIPTKALTEGQAKDLTYAQRTDQSSPKIESLGRTIVSLNPVSFTTQMKLADSPLTSGQVSKEIRQYNQAVKNFITATLRRESGAQINPSEFQDAYRVYIPFPGDDEETLRAKKQARDTAIASFKSNVPGYSARVSTPESSYLDVVEASLGRVEEKTTPISTYTSRLIGLPGVK